MQEDELILHNKTYKLFKIQVDIYSDFGYTIPDPNWRSNDMKQLGIRLRTLWEGIGLSQSKIANMIGFYAVQH